MKAQKDLKSGSYVLQQDGHSKEFKSESDDYSSPKKSTQTHPDVAKNSNVRAAYESNNNSNNTYIIMINKNYNGTTSGKSSENQSISHDARNSEK